MFEELERGITVLEGTGAYTGAERPVLYCVISRAEVATLKAIVQEVDPHAFMVIGSPMKHWGKDSDRSRISKRLRVTGRNYPNWRITPAIRLICPIW